MLLSVAPCSEFPASSRLKAPLTMILGASWAGQPQRIELAPKDDTSTAALWAQNSCGAAADGVEPGQPSSFGRALQAATGCIAVTAGKILASQNLV
jgi:hypothetical protein